jgi:hypothetical protein
VASGQWSKDIGGAERYFHHTLPSREKTIICTDAKMYLFDEREVSFLQQSPVSLKAAIQQRGWKGTYSSPHILPGVKSMCKSGQSSPPW